jgi:YD repeat-containing protein
MVSASPSSVALTGFSNSSTFPLAQAYQASNAGSYDAFVTRLNPSTAGSGSLLSSTYLGTSGDDRGLGIAVAGSTVTLTGSTTSSTFPSASATQPVFGGGTCGTTACPDAFVTQLNLASNTLSFSSFLGGSNNDQATGVALESAGAIDLTGTTFSSNFPTTGAALQGSFNTGGGARDAFVAKISPSSTQTTRVISYSYDGLQRLTGAAELPGGSYAYAYDDAGNRTGVWVNGTRTVTQTFNAANQVSGFSYDAAGNLTNDGTATYGYDALGRMTIRNTTPYTYNGDGALVFDPGNRPRTAPIVGHQWRLSGTLHTLVQWDNPQWGNVYHTRQVGRKPHPRYRTNTRRPA